MEIINISQEELRVTADTLRYVRALAGDENARAVLVVAAKFEKLADKLDADKLDAMTFCAAKGVQA